MTNGKQKTAFKSVKEIRTQQDAAIALNLQHGGPPSPSTVITARRCSIQTSGRSIIAARSNTPIGHYLEARFDAA